jgi:ribose transport system substrate-binding protein
MKKNAVSILSIFFIFILLMGCAGKQTGNQSVNSNTKAPDVELPKGASVEAVKQMPKEPLRIAFLSFQNNPFWFPVRDGANAAKKYLKNFNTTVDYVVMGEELTADRVVSAMETAITQQYDAIVVVPIFDGTEVIINKAVDAGIPVMSVVAEGEKKSKRIAFMGQDAYAAGQLAGKTIEDLTGGSGKVGVITGVFGATQHENRMNGALDYIKDKVPGIEIVGKYENKDKAETAYTLTKDMITANPDIKVIYVTAGGPFGAAKAIQDLGLTGKVQVVCYDHIPENVEYVRSGEIAAAIAQDPFGQGFNSLVTMYNHLVTGDKPAKDFLPVNLDILTPDNVDELFPK